MKKLNLALILMLAGSATAYAQETSHKNGLLSDAGGRVLYTFDKDAANKSSCSGGCLAAWPAFAAKAGDKPASGYSIVTRDDGSLQWALNGKPLYYFAGDSTPGDANGDGQGGVWHVIRDGAAKSAAAPQTGYSYGSY